MIPQVFPGAHQMSRRGALLERGR